LILQIFVKQVCRVCSVTLVLVLLFYVGIRVAQSV